MTKELTASKVKKILIHQYGWDKKSSVMVYYGDELISDTLKVVNKILKEQTNKSKK